MFSTCYFRKISRFARNDKFSRLITRPSSVDAFIKKVGFSDYVIRACQRRRQPSAYVPAFLAIAGRSTAERNLRMTVGILYVIFPVNNIVKTKEYTKKQS